MDTRFVRRDSHTRSLSRVRRRPLPADVAHPSFVSSAARRVRWVAPISVLSVGVAVLLVLLLTGCGYSHPETTTCLLYTSPSPRDRTRSRMPSSA